MQFTIRNFKEEDASRISSIIEECFKLIDLGNHTAEGIRLQIEANRPELLIEKSKTVTYFVAAYNDNIVGICGYRKNKIQTLFVDINYHHDGIGSALLAKVLADAKSNGLSRVFTWSTVFAENLYSSFGFRKEQEIFFPDGSKDIGLILMTKVLE